PDTAVSAAERACSPTGTVVPSRRYADEEFGRLRDATVENDRQHILAEAKFGEHCLSNASARAALVPAMTALRSAEGKWSEQYCRPLWAAAVRLAETPAPTLPAALFKVDVIRLEELWNDSSMTRDVMEIISEDLARFVASPPQARET